jgi:hypothetical protein
MSILHPFTNTEAVKSAGKGTVTCHHVNNAPGIVRGGPSALRLQRRIEVRSARSDRAAQHLLQLLETDLGSTGFEISAAVNALIAAQAGTSRLPATGTLEQTGTWEVRTRLPSNIA